MEYRIEKYTVSELQEYIDSEDYKNAGVLPISPDRAKSVIENPRGDKHDVVLITARQGNKLLGYKTALPDYFFNGAEKIKLAWISGSWTDPDYRRKGLASTLFFELDKAWNSALIYTNYAPASKKMFDKTNVFETYRSHNGCRCYLRFNAGEIVPARFSWMKPLTPLLGFLDRILNATLLHVLVNKVKAGNIELSYPEILDDRQISKLFENTLSGRGKSELEWIMSTPWVIDESMKGDRDKRRFFFSWIARPYRLYFLVINRGTDQESVFMISLKGSQMKVPYYSIPEKPTYDIASVLFAEARRNKVSVLDVFDENLKHFLIKNKTNFIFVREQNRKYMVSKRIIGGLPDSNAVKVPDGEGDVVFV